MQVYTLIMLMGLLMSGSERLEADPPDSWPLSPAGMWLTMLLPHALLIGLILLVCRLATKRAQNSKSNRLMHRIGRTEAWLTAIRFTALAVFLTDLFILDRLLWLQQQLGHWILLNDLLAMLPPLTVVVACWWFVYPLHRMLRMEAASEPNASEGFDPPPIPTRRQFLIMQIRHQLLLMLVPLLALLGWVQAVDWLALRLEAVADHRFWVLMFGTVCVFLLAPLMIRLAWDTEPMPAGPLRDRLESLCEREGVRVRALLLWKTYRGMINGAVLGMIGPLRYILLTDGLIERMSDRQIEAVMAHELGHVKGHHMPWMAVCAVAMLVAVTSGVDAMVSEAGYGLDLALRRPPDDSVTAMERAVEVGAMVLTLVVWAVGFGFVSRRFERQADTHAARHMTEVLRDKQTERPEVFSQEATDQVAEALMTVARLNHIPLDTERAGGWRRKIANLGSLIYHWRHGSIRWRADYLRSLSGLPLASTRNDRFLRVCCWACLGALALYFGWAGSIG